MPDDFKLNQIGVIMLGVKEAARSVAFYRDQLGLTVKMAFEGFTFLDAGAVTLVLSEALAKASSSSVAGATEVVFSVPDVRAAHAALRSKCVEFTHEPRQVSGPMWAAISVTRTATASRCSGLSELRKCHNRFYSRRLHNNILFR